LHAHLRRLPAGVRLHYEVGGEGRRLPQDAAARIGSGRGRGLKSGELEGGFGDWLGGRDSGAPDSGNSFSNET
jgi:hypothetical protein